MVWHSISFYSIYNSLDFIDNASLLHVAQAVVASVFAILLGTIGMTAICREQIRCLRITAVLLLVVAFITGFGMVSFPGLTPVKVAIFPVLSGGVGALLFAVFSLLYPPSEPDYSYVKRNRV